jgi:hypothetical protein
MAIPEQGLPTGLVATEASPPEQEDRDPVFSKLIRGAQQSSQQFPQLGEWH